MLSLRRVNNRYNISNIQGFDSNQSEYIILNNVDYIYKINSLPIFNLSWKKTHEGVFRTLANKIGCFVEFHTNILKENIVLN